MDLTIDCYKEYVDWEFHNSTRLKEFTQNIQNGQKIIGCNLENIKSIFTAIESIFPTEKLTIVSYESDYGVNYQAEEHPNVDVYKCAMSIDYDSLSKERRGYVQPTLQTLRAENCNPNDRYSIKMNRFTHSTFDKIPENITWFTVNNNISESNVHFLPFGMNKQGEGKNLIDKWFKKWENKTQYIYANFQCNTVDRMKLKDHFRELSKNPENNSWLTYRENNLPIEQFYEELANHKYNICSPSNGLDLFSVYECLQVDTFPIMKHSRFTNNMYESGLYDILLTPDISKLNKQRFEKALLPFQTSFPFNRELLTKQYWGKKIRESIQ